MQLLISLLTLTYAHSVNSANLTLLTSVNCRDEVTLSCTSTGCVGAYIFSKNNKTLINQADNATNKYSASVISSSEVQLTIRNIELSDAGSYSCSCGFDISSLGQALHYQCKAATSTFVIGTDKKVNISVDMLYPRPSGIATALTNTIYQLSGEYFCELSATFRSHYRCTWVATSSLLDGNHSYAITVTTGTQIAHVYGYFMIVTPPSPSISNLVTISQNRQVLHGVQDTLMTIQCVSMGGIPAPTLAWYRGNTSTSPLAQSDSAEQSNGTMYLIYSFTPNRTDDMTKFLCRVFYPGATNEASPDPNPALALLYLDLKPGTPTVSQTSEAVSGRSVTLQCTTTSGRPPPKITWSYHDQTLNGTNNSSFDPTSETFTVVSVLHTPVYDVDNGQKATCRVSHITLLADITGTVIVDVKFRPSLGSTTIFGNQETPATARHQIKLNCTSGSSNPASNITWYNGSIVMPNLNYTRWPGDNNGVITSSILTIAPTRYMDGDIITCTADNGFGSDNKSVALNIFYSPLLHPLPNITAIEGEENVSLSCSASSKPPATFTWNKGNVLLVTGTGTHTHNSLSYVIPRVDRTYAGSYKCRASNNIGEPNSKDTHLNVTYPPTVTVTTISYPFYNVICTAEGNPDSYTYQDWIQIWPGYGIVATILFTGTTLTLIDATYESSGVYVCGVSNGVSLYGKGTVVRQANATLRIEAPPVLIDPIPAGTRHSVAGKLGQDASTDIKYWFDGDSSNVKCYRSLGASRSSSVSCSVTATKTEVTLPVYNHKVPETGTLATIKIHIISETDFAEYDLVVSTNAQKEAVLGITIVPEGPPEAPVLTDNITVTSDQVILTVLPGFHGGSNQTLVVQISTDILTWTNNTSVNIGLKKRPTDVHLTNLLENTLHYMRVFAYNKDGSSNFSRYLNFSTPKGMSDTTGHSSVTLIAGLVVGVCVPVIIGIIAFYIWRVVRGRKPRAKDTRNLANGNDTSDVVVECAVYESAGRIHVPSRDDLYSKPLKATKKADLYAAIIKPKKDDKAPKLFHMDGRAARNISQATTPSAPSRPKKNLNQDGLIYADLEFSNNPEMTVIHGLDNATTYVQVDFTKAADPLSDSEEETQVNT